MSDRFFLAVGVMFTGIGQLLLTAKVLTYIKCTVPINATVVKPAKEHTYFRGVKHTHDRPVVRYVVDGKSYTEKAYFRTYRKTKYPIGSEIAICYNPKSPEKNAIRRASVSSTNRIGVSFYRCCFDLVLFSLNPNKMIYIIMIEEEKI